MFAKLKDKLKSALSIFSKKAEEEAEVKVVETPLEIKPKEIVPEVKLKEVISEIKPKAVAPEVKIKELPQKEEKKVAKKKEEPKKVTEKKETIPEKKETIPEKETVKKEGLSKIPSDQVKITYFVHGNTTDNEKEIATGWNQGELSAKGVQQSKELWEKIKDKHFDIVFSSDLKRAVHSAELTFERKISLRQDHRLRECNYGEFNGKKVELFKSNLIDNITRPFTAGESYQQVEKRMAEFLNYLYENYKGKHIAIVAHQAPQLAMDVLLQGKTWAQAIQEDWRLRKAWQPGWEYWIKNKIEIKELSETKKSFLGKLFGKKEEAAPQVVKEEAAKIEKAEEKPAEEQKTFFGKLKQSITTKTISAEKFNELFWDLEIVLLENNVSVEVTERIKKDLEQELVDKPLPRDVESKILETLKKTLLDILTFEDINLLGKINEKGKQKKPFVIAFFGINGTGKTTSIAKLTHYFQQQKKSVVLAACDTFRAAAIQQLEEHADKLGVKMIKQDYGADAAAVAFDAVKYAEKNKIDIVLIDTAGRLHSNTNLMAELGKIIRIAKPDFKIFVGESITGNDCIEQARQFNQLVEMDGAILTKADVDEKGGAPLSIAYTIKKPILFLGVGQRYQDLEKFEAQQIVKRLGL